MSALGQKRTLLRYANNVRFRGKSGHQLMYITAYRRR